MKLFVVLGILASQTSAQHNLTCTFSNRTLQSVVYYSCTLTRILVMENSEEISVDGKHFVNKSNNDVEQIFIDYSKTNFVISELFHIFTNIKLFWLNYNDMEFWNFNLPGFIFSAAAKLDIFVVQNGNLRTIDENAFMGLRSLRMLYLNNNQIRALPTAVFYPLRRLRYLNLNVNQLTRLDNKLFMQNGGQLYDLFIQSNQIREIGPNFVDNLTALNTLYLNTNNCTNNQFIRGTAGRLDFTAVRNALATCFRHYQESSKEEIQPIDPPSKASKLLLY
jgi:hypothetical protein